MTFPSHICSNRNFSTLLVQRSSLKGFRQTIPKEISICGFVFFYQPQGMNVSRYSTHSLHFHLISICFLFSLSFLLSLPLFSSLQSSNVLSLQPPQSSSHRESWKQSKNSPLSPGWVTSNLGPQASLQTCGPQSRQLRDAIV